MKGNINRAIAVFACTLAVVIILFSIGYKIHCNKKAELIYQNICQQLESFPDNVSASQSNSCYFRGDNEEYLFVCCDGVTIVGKRDQSGVVYYVEEKGCVDQAGVPLEATFSKETVFSKIHKAVDSYLSQKGVTYTYHKTSSGSLPLWISPLDAYYLWLSRPGYANYIEVMTNGGGESNTHIHWNILTPDENVVLYLCVSEQQLSNERTYVPGWGEIPQHLLAR